MVAGNEMMIEVERLTDEGEGFEKVYAPGALSLEDEYASLLREVRFDGRVSKKHDEVCVQGSIETAVGLLCDRCLSPVVVAVKIDFKAELVAALEAGTEARELQDADLDISVYEGATINLDEIVREQILLSLPTRQLCGEDCRGLCASCGANLNANACACERQQVDPRWSALAALKSDKNAES